MSLKVIYIDDESELCQAFVDNFESSKIKISTFTDPEQGIAEIITNGADLVFLDYRLPNTNGIKVATKIPDHIPVAMISGELSLKAGDRFLRVFGKPFEIEEIESFMASIDAAKRAD